MMTKLVDSMTKLPRWFWAWLFGYSWGPCPICGRAYAGFEMSTARVIVYFDYAALALREKYVCNRCTTKAEESNYQKFGISRISDKEVSVMVDPALLGPAYQSRKSSQLMEANIYTDKESPNAGT